MDRLALLVVVVMELVGCAATVEDPCGPDTCAGCCEHGRCVPGASDEACGLAGGFCQRCAVGGLTCQHGACGGGTTQQPDSGVKIDAGTPDAGSPILVTLVYQRDEVDAGACPITHVMVECRETKTISDARLQSLKTVYSECSFFEMAGGGAYRWECSNCLDRYKEANCTYDDGGVDLGSVYDCTWPKYTVESTCAWQLP